MCWYLGVVFKREGLELCSASICGSQGGWLGVLLWFGGAHGVWSVKGLWDHSGLDLSSLWVIDWGPI